jgi:hypothetical protein
MGPWTVLLPRTKVSCQFLFRQSDPSSCSDDFAELFLLKIALCPQPSYLQCHDDIPRHAFAYYHLPGWRSQPPPVLSSSSFLLLTSSLVFFFLFLFLNSFFSSFVGLLMMKRLWHRRSPIPYVGKTRPVCLFACLLVCLSARLQICLFACLLIFILFKRNICLVRLCHITIFTQETHFDRHLDVHY